MARAFGRRGAGVHDHDDDATGGDSLNPADITTDELVNAPLLLAQKHRYICERIDGTGELQQITNGSGSVSDLQGAVEVSTGTTGDSFAEIVAENFSYQLIDFGIDMVIRFNLDLEAIGGASGDQMYALMTRNKVNEDTYTQAHLGIGVLAGDLVATSADGSTQGTTTIEASVGETFKTVWIVWDAAAGSAEYYIGTPPQDGSPDATHSSNVPGDGDRASDMNLVADNDSNGNDNSIRISEYAQGVE